MGEEYSPGAREIVATIIEIWKHDPASELLSYGKLLARVKEKKADAHWVLSEKRMKAALKEFNLQPNKQLFTFVKETKSEPVANLRLPPGVTLQQTKGRGKALFASKSFRQGEKIWDEMPLVQAARVEMLRLMRTGRCCAYCSTTLRTTADGDLQPQSGVKCINCTANWCSNSCKRLDIIHADTYHASLRTFKPIISCQRWKIYEHFCLEQNWQAGYLFAITLLYKIKHGPQSAYARAMAGMAHIPQDFRQQAVSQPNSLEFEQHEQMWKRGFDLLVEAVKPVYKLEYSEYMEGIGMVNINNLQGCIFEVHSNLNHNCEPSVKVNLKSRADGIEVFANTDIAPGQELTTTYVNPRLGYDERQSTLRINWGFICSCGRCKRDHELKVNPPKPPKSVLKSSNDTPPLSPIEKENSKRERSKSVHFEENPVTLEISRT